MLNAEAVERISASFVKPDIEKICNNVNAILHTNFGGRGDSLFLFVTSLLMCRAAYYIFK